MDYPEINEAVLERLDELGFEGTDASMTTSLFEYAGLWSEKYGVAMLCEPDSQDPRIEFQHISKEDIAKEVELAGGGFTSFMDAVNCGLPKGMSAIQSLMMWSGGWHRNDHYWTRLSKWEPEEMIRVLETMCGEEGK